MLFHFAFSVSKVKHFNSLVGAEEHIKFLIKRCIQARCQPILVESRNKSFR